MTNQLKTYEELLKEIEDLKALHEKDFVDLCSAKELHSESERRLREVLENSLVASYKRSFQTNSYEYLSPVFTRLFGYTPEEFIAFPLEKVLAIIHPNDLPEINRVISDASSGLPGAAYQAEYRLRHRNGHYLWVHDQFTVIYNSDGLPHAFIGSVSEITDRKRSEETLLFSESVYRKLFEEHSAIKLMLNPDNGDILDANEAAADFYGWPRELLRKMNISQINILPTAKIQNELNKTKNRNKTHFEFTHRRADGSLRNVEVFSTSISAPDGKDFLHSIIFDITVRKKAQEALSKSEERLRRAELASKTGNWEIHLPSQRLTVSDGAAKVYGLDKNTITWQAVKNVRLPEYSAAIDLAINRLVEYGAPFNLEYKIKNAETGKIVDIHSIAEYDETNRTIFGILQDITERKYRENELRKSQQFLHSAMDAISSHLSILNEDGMIITVNHAWRVFARANNAREGAVCEGANYILLCDQAQGPGSDDASAFAQGFRSIINGHQDGFSMEYSCHSPEEKRWFHVNITRFTIGDTLFLVVAHEDITVPKFAAEETASAYKKLEKLNFEKDKLFSIIAHDLRSPFHGLLGLTELMAEKSLNFLPADVQKYSMELHASVKKIYTLLENLLQWAQFQKGSIAFSPKQVLLQDLVAQSIDIMRQPASQKEIFIQSFVPSGLSVTVDEKMITSVLRNLLSNAVKFTRRGGNISIKATDLGHKIIQITITDNGVGILLETIPKLFTLGEKVYSAGTENEPSIGLGLILCKEFIEKHGGSIWAESIQENESLGLPGTTTFSFTVPGVL